MFVSVSLLAAIFQTLFESLLKSAGCDSVQDGVQGAVYWKDKNHHPQNDGTWRRQREREKKVQIKPYCPREELQSHSS